MSLDAIITYSLTDLREVTYTKLSERERFSKQEGKCVFVEEYGHFRQKGKWEWEQRQGSEIAGEDKEVYHCCVPERWGLFSVSMVTYACINLALRMACQQHRDWGGGLLGVGFLWGDFIIITFFPFSLLSGLWLVCCFKWPLGFKAVCFVLVFLESVFSLISWYKTVGVIAVWNWGFLFEYIREDHLNW